MALQQTKGLFELGISENNTMTRPGWAVHVEDGMARLVMSAAECVETQFLGGELAGFGVVTHMTEADAPIPDEAVTMAQVMIIEVKPNSEQSLRRLLNLKMENPRLPVIAAVRDATIPLVRTLLQAGVDDVVALPLVQSELSATLERIRDEINRNSQQQQKKGKIISVVGSIGGVGATMFAAQAGALQAARDKDHQGESCLFDLDLQFGNVATYLGLSPKLTISDLLEAGGRFDTALLRAVTAQAENGLSVVAAPSDIIPLESVSADQLYNIVDLAAREFDTVFIDLPGIWTNWSLSLTARSDIIVLLVELSVASLRQAKRQIMLLASQGIGMESLVVVANRVQKKLFKTISFDDAERALGHKISYSISSDFGLVSAALDQGVTLHQVKSNSRVEKDILTILDGCEDKMARGR